jgi:putative endonuclease
LGRQRSELRLGKPADALRLHPSERNRQKAVLHGLTDDLRKRLQDHNAGRVIHSRKWKPWRLKNYIAFSERLRAAKFERYLKSASGRAFVKNIFKASSAVLVCE